MKAVETGGRDTKRRCCGEAGVFLQRCRERERGKVVRRRRYWAVGHVEGDPDGWKGLYLLEAFPTSCVVC